MAVERSRGWSRIIADGSMPLDVVVMVGLNTCFCYIGDLGGHPRYETVDRQLNLQEIVAEAKRFSRQCKFRLTYNA